MATLSPGHYRLGPSEAFNVEEKAVGAQCGCLEMIASAGFGRIRRTSFGQAERHGTRASVKHRTIQPPRSKVWPSVSIRACFTAPG